MRFDLYVFCICISSYVDAFTMLALHRQRTAIIVRVLTDLPVHRPRKIIFALFALLRQTIEMMILWFVTDLFVNRLYKIRPALFLANLSALFAFFTFHSRVKEPISSVFTVVWSSVCPSFAVVMRWQTASTKVVDQ